MLRSTNALDGYTLLARDEEAGEVRDFFFDDRSWTVRYLVVKTGGWLFGRKVLVAPEALDRPDWEGKRLPARLTKEQVKDSPDIDLARPVSRQQAIELHRYYGWTSPYWFTAGPHFAPPPIPPVPPQGVETEEGDPHLRSTGEVIKYHLQATDGEIGHVEDFLVDDGEWVIRYMVADTRNWLPGKTVILPVGIIRRVVWSERKVFLNITREEVKESPPFDPASPPDRERETRMFDHFGWPKYWT